MPQDTCPRCKEYMGLVIGLCQQGALENAYKLGKQNAKINTNGR